MTANEALALSNEAQRMERVNSDKESEKLLAKVLKQVRKAALAGKTQCEVRLPKRLLVEADREGPTLKCLRLRLEKLGYRPRSYALKRRPFFSGEYIFSDFYTYATQVIVSWDHLKEEA